MKTYAEKMMELAPRDIVSRSEMTEIEAGRGFQGPKGLDHVMCDLRHLGRETILERLPLIREVAIKFNDLDPIDQPIPVQPVAHYSMGGIHVSKLGETPVAGIWGAGEVSCVSIHGANRLGTNSTAECLAYGGITGREAANYAMKAGAPPLATEKARAEESRVTDEIFKRQTKEDLYAVRNKLREVMDSCVGVFRTREGLETAVTESESCKRG